MTISPDEYKVLLSVLQNLEAQAWFMLVLVAALGIVVVWLARTTTKLEKALKDVRWDVGLLKAKAKREMGEPLQ